MPGAIEGCHDTVPWSTVPLAATTSPGSENPTVRPKPAASCSGVTRPVSGRLAAQRLDQLGVGEGVEVDGGHHAVDGGAHQGELPCLGQRHLQRRTHLGQHQVGLLGRCERLGEHQPRAVAGRADRAVDRPAGGGEVVEAQVGHQTGGGGQQLVVGVHRDDHRARSVLGDRGGHVDVETAAGQQDQQHQRDKGAP